MNISSLSEFLNGDRFKLPSSRVSDFSQLWTPKEVGQHVIRLLPPHPVKCPSGTGYNIVHWGIAKSSIRCAMIEEDYLTRKEDMGGKEPCLCCRLYNHFVETEGKNEKMQELRNNMRPQKLVMYPVYLPKVIGYEDKKPIIDESCDPTIAIWQISQFTLQNSMDTVTRSNELLVDPIKGKFIIITITNQKGAKKYPAPDFYPKIGGMPMHSDTAVMAKMLDELYPDVVKASSGGKKKDEDIQKLIMGNEEIRPYIQ